MRHTPHSPITLSELALLTGAHLIGDPHHTIEGVENLDAALSHEAAFLENPRYTRQLENAQAGVIFVHTSLTNLPAGKNYLVTPHPSLSFQKVVELYVKAPQTGFIGIHPTAVVHEEATLGDGVTIGPHAVIDQGVKIGPNTRIGPGVYIGAESSIGSECCFHAHVTVREGCEIGNRVTLQPGVVIGSCGFGYFTDARGKHTPLKQLGKVVIEDDVEIGANTTVDRARFKETRIQRGTKIDNLVQIAHQVEIGQDNLIVSQVGVAGSTKTGKNVVIGGQVGIAGHLTIANGVVLAARAGVSKSLLEPGPYSGAPALPLKEFYTLYTQQKNVGKLSPRIKELETKVAELEKAKDKV